ncbi:hypothetical protein CA54_54670 [Symmachiella macrocystis]|uniref:Uncharacterized protein n=1 Tax=Symmachiella macrocystis TaxID=2527985 RepID=A0A5C6B646_9PLAN|nr:hypothetical protein CA54_54670 [Symmachiella macrocystis]
MCLTIYYIVPDWTTIKPREFPPSQSLPGILNIGTGRPIPKSAQIAANRTHACAQSWPGIHSFDFSSPDWAPGVQTSPPAAALPSGD